MSITSQIYFCGIPFRLDTSPTCAFGCRYCFRTHRGGNNSVHSSLASVSRLAKKLTRAAIREPHARDAVEELLVRRVPIHFGGLSDPFCDETTSTLSIAVLRELAGSNQPTVLCTKNLPRLIHDDALSVLNRFKSLVIQTSFSCFSKNTARILEPYAPSPNERLLAMQFLSSNGFIVTARCQPVFMSLVPEISGDLIPSIAVAGANHVSVEYLKLPVERSGRNCLASLPTPLATDVANAADGSHLRIGRELLLPSTTRWDLSQPIIAAIRGEGMTYGAADYGLYHLGDTHCCCGLSKMPGFENYFRANITTAIRRRHSESIIFDTISKYWTPSKSVRRYFNSTSRRPGASTVKDFLLAKWNRPGTANAPDQYLGVQFSGDRDSHGNCIYFFQPG